MLTLSNIKADTGGSVGHTAVHPEMVAGDMFDDPGSDRARDTANEVTDDLRRHGPFEPLDEPAAVEAQAPAEAPTPDPVPGP